MTQLNDVVERLADLDKKMLTSSWDKSSKLGQDLTRSASIEA
jgi:hypothetical protein